MSLKCSCILSEGVHSTQSYSCKGAISRKALHCDVHLQGFVKVVQGVLAVQLARHSCAVSTLSCACNRCEPVLQLHPERSQRYCWVCPSFWTFSLPDQAMTNLRL